MLQILLPANLLLSEPLHFNDIGFNIVGELALSSRLANE